MRVNLKDRNSAELPGLDNCVVLIEMTEYSSIRKISKPRFDALCFSRRPRANLVAEELEWYADQDEIIIATIYRDRIDHDYGFIILGRDERALFRCIDNALNFIEIDKARVELNKKVAEMLKRGDAVFPQGDNKGKKNQIYNVVVKDGKLHPHFKELLEKEIFSPAKEIIAEIVYAFEDADGNYIQQFQSTGFNARLWELYLYAYLHEEDFEIEREFSAPDYVGNKFGETVCIEAVTVNPTDKEKTAKKAKSVAQIRKRLRDYIPIKYGSALFSKLRKRYWEKPHVQGKPFILAIQDFHEEGSMAWSGSALSDYLYGYRYSTKRDEFGNLEITPIKIRKHRFGKKEIPSGFFFLLDAENISGVLFNSSATISKFNRMGKLAGFGSQRVRMIRSGAYHDHDPNADEPIPFRIIVDPDKCSETWGEGTSIFHNPRALHPLEPAFFPQAAHHRFEDGFIISEIPEFHPIGSFTHNYIDR